MNSKFFDLLQSFRRLLPARNMEELERRLARAQEKGDLSALAKTYYGMGVHCMENSDPNHAWLYLHRSFSIYGSRDDIRVKKSMRRDCFQRIHQLPEQLTYEILKQLREQAEFYLEDQQIRLWGLMTLARLVKVGESLSALPGCEVLGNLGQAADLILRSFQEPISQEEQQFLRDTCDRLYDLGDDACFFDMTQQVEVQDGMPLQVFDLNSILSELYLYLNSHLKLLTKGPDNSEAEIGFVPCALLPDYYLRTCGTDLTLLPQINREIDRIHADYEFVRSKVTWQDIAQRVAQYKELNILMISPS